MLPRQPSGKCRSPSLVPIAALARPIIATGFPFQMKSGCTAAPRLAADRAHKSATQCPTTLHHPSGDRPSAPSSGCNAATDPDPRTPLSRFGRRRSAVAHDSGSAIGLQYTSLGATVDREYAPRFRWNAFLIGHRDSSANWLGDVAPTRAHAWSLICRNTRGRIAISLTVPRLLYLGGRKPGDAKALAQALDLVGSVAHVAGHVEAPFGFHAVSEKSQAFGRIDVRVVLQASTPVRIISASALVLSSDSTCACLRCRGRWPE